MAVARQLFFCFLLSLGLSLAVELGAAHNQTYYAKPKPKPKHNLRKYGVDPQTTKYVMVTESPNPYVRDKARCLAKNRCFLRKLKCPRQCPKRHHTKYHASECFVDCSRKCQTSCKHRKPNCHGYSSVCYDPRFVGGDGVMFYFHGKAGEDFCLVTDPSLHINAHFIGLRPTGRTRDFTWVQALGILFENHTFSVAARKTAAWRDEVDALEFTYDGEAVHVAEGAGATWSAPMDEVRVERLGDTNSVQVSVDGLMTVAVEAVPITGEEDRVHGYGLPADDCFAHLNTQFSFLGGLSPSVDGVLGQTYRPGFHNPVKVGVPMPIMGGETNFHTSSLFSTDCLANQFHIAVAASRPQLLPSTAVNAKCSSTSTAGGILCRR